MTLHAGLRAIVADASAAVRFLQRDPVWLNLWEAWAKESAMVLAPPHFPAEVANALLRSAQVPAVEVIISLDRLARSGVETAQSGPSGLAEAVALADRHRLTVYDALYLQLALDIEAELATLDQDLAAAARREGVPLVS